MKKAKDVNNGSTEHRLIKNRLDVVCTKTSDNSNEKLFFFFVFQKAESHMIYSNFQIRKIFEKEHDKSFLLYVLSRQD